MNLPIASDLFHLLVCPVARKPLKLVGGRLVSTDAATRRAYRIEGDMPVMIVEESEVLDESTWKAEMAKEGPVGQGLAGISHAKGQG